MLKDEITIKEIKKLFANRALKVDYISRLSVRTGRAIDCGRNEQTINQAIIDTWEYEASKDIIREMYVESPKFHIGETCKESIDAALLDWQEKNLGEFVWPFSAMNFDKRVVAINRMPVSEDEKDSIVSKEVIKFRRIKDINTMRNDYIEFLIFSHNDNIIPTISHRSGVDFYIDGEPYDQKVSKSVGGDFVNAYGDNYRDVAIAHPELVAKSLYENQDSERFDANPRLYIVYLDPEVSNSQIESILSNIDFSQPYQIEFDYEHSNVIEHHATHCFVVLLHN